VTLVDEGRWILMGILLALHFGGVAFNGGSTVLYSCKTLGHIRGHKILSAAHRYSLL
jgi:hypothetical protein